MISFNIGSSDDKNGNSIAERAPRLSAITSRYNADIMPDSVGYATMIKHFRDGNTCTANDLGTTYHNYRPKEITTDHIDYCFIDQNIIPLDQKIMTDTVEGKYPSDHLDSTLSWTFNADPNLCEV